MQTSGQRASRLNSATINHVEAALLAPLAGARLQATVIEVRSDDRGTVQLAEPAVTASAPLPTGTQPGSAVSLTVVRVDISAGEVEFAL